MTGFIFWIVYLCTTDWSRGISGKTINFDSTGCCWIYVYITHDLSIIYIYIYIYNLFIFIGNDACLLGYYSQ